MIGLLKTKLALLIHTKVGATVVAAALVTGGGTAVAATVTHGHLNEIGSAIVSVANGEHATATKETNGENNNGTSDSHESAEGTLMAYTAPNGSTAGSISVQPNTGSAVTFEVTGATKVNGYQASGQQGTSQENSGAKQPEGTKSTGEQSNNEPSGTLKDLAAAIGQKVQVQADHSGSNWIASKVTIEGPQAGETGDANNGDHSEHDVSGKVKSVNGSAFVVTTGSGDVVVTVNSSTHFSGQAASTGGLSVGMSVEIQGTKQTDGSVLATSVAVHSAEGTGGEGTSGGGHDATPTAGPKETPPVKGD